MVALLSGLKELTRETASVAAAARRPRRLELFRGSLLLSLVPTHRETRLVDNQRESRFIDRDFDASAVLERSFVSTERAARFYDT